MGSGPTRQDREAPGETRAGNREMTKVRLPELPEGRELEELVSAILQTGGFYVERNIVDREVEELLELDIVLTGYEVGAAPEITLVEVKAGRWGFSDIFKVRGWMCYLCEDKALFIVRQVPEHVDFFRRKADGLGIRLIMIEDLRDAAEALSGPTGIDRPPGVDVLTWRFSYWTERSLVRRLNVLNKSGTGKKCYPAMVDYYFKVNSGIFFIQNTVERLEELYSAFQCFPRISAKTGHESKGDDFDDDHVTVPTDVFEATYYQCEYTDIQLSTYIEHRARLAILKNGVDYKLYESRGMVERASDHMTIRAGDREFRFPRVLPPRFLAGLETICREPYFHRYPVFWQWFLWVFGGFILTDHQDREYELLSAKTGVPVEEIPRALESYGRLFPHDGGWFQESDHANIRFMKMFPVPFMGIGANYRRLVYTETGKFEDIELRGTYTRNDLVRWNNLVVDVLSRA